MIRSRDAATRGIDNSAPVDAFNNLVRLCDQILEPLRNSISKPINVTSGFRCPALNAIVGGEKDSDHLVGRAADIVVAGMTTEELASAVKVLSKYVPLKQCIVEFPKSPDGGWVHVSCTPLNVHAGYFEPEFLVANRVNGEKKYTPWEPS